ncbi:hypothetical protein [Okeania sp. SIO1F9]|uniref:hypothetical protein n=1 Tax=Okeania sp. SIO1F9 TaxID=2607813 RepID=UPI00144E0390|nr:hypothetical protein [Okeania sp. SIO1F9]NET79401.1 hypothetical protein [Okeania sp. SIO1F9]
MNNQPKINSLFSKISKGKQKIIQKIQHSINHNKILSHRLIFCINSGRSGSNYLSELLGTAEEVISYHEPSPSMTGDYLTMVNKSEYATSFSKRRFKSSAIKDILLKIPDGKIYCETNHMFIKTFFDVVAQDFPKIEVIILRRYLPKVLKSFIELGYFSDKNQAWKFWMSSPNAVTAAIPCIDVDVNLDQWDLSIAYLIDIEARAKRFQQEYPGINTYEVCLEELNNFAKVESLFEQLKISLTDSTKKMYTQKINQRKETKKKYSGKQDISLSHCQERIEEYIQRANDLNISIPTTLALESY